MVLLLSLVILSPLSSLISIVKFEVKSLFELSASVILGIISNVSDLPSLSLILNCIPFAVADGLLSSLLSFAILSFVV
ncbi:hypothetical protein [Clostridium sp. SM-530-WT-3G]|uniref:hypothetical protein n=1 Tax=Clostridium sp. SM-530-WT-3G TaxID=2725303 RepID=UPI00145F0FF8|nr:hypothetical protein [Clostridium sp. SM-530-WT-3G]